MRIYIKYEYVQGHIKATVGINNGLKLILDLHSDQETFGTVQSDWSGFQVRSQYFKTRLCFSSDKLFYNFSKEK